MVVRGSLPGDPPAINKPEINSSVEEVASRRLLREGCLEETVSIRLLRAGCFE
jgi:hypothetical protein